MRQALTIVGAAVSVLTSVQALAQSPACDDVNPTIQGATLNVRVATLGTAYQYSYTIVNPSVDTGCIRLTDVDLPVRSPVPREQMVMGPGVRSNFPSLGRSWNPPGTYSCAVLPLCDGAIGGDGGLDFDCSRTLDGTWGPRVYAGQSFDMCTIVSPYPPGPRTYTLEPEWNDASPNTTLVPPDDQDLFSLVDVHGTTLGPVAPSELVFYNGGGQKPDDVNLFLTYTNPVASKTQLRATETSFPVGLKYGPTTIASTFQAKLNGVDITSRFHPAAGRIEAVTLTLVAGSNSLVLSIDGKNAHGATATDTDRLTLQVGK